MQVTATGIELIHHFENFSSKPYLCPAKVPTIGWGNTFYPNGKKVTLKDTPITREKGDEIFKWVLSLFEADVTSLLKAALKPYQFDALVSFAYNIGSDIDSDDIPEGLGDSTLLKKVNANPGDPSIVNEFLKWNKSNKKILPGLTRRRTIEAHYYITGILKLK
jgi:lysozyme